MSATDRAPFHVRLFSPILERLVRIGVPLGFNGTLTIRGRKTGEPRTTTLAIIEDRGRRWVWAPWGEVNWVRNLRAAGRAIVTKRKQRDEVEARELTPTERVGFFRDVVGPVARRYPGGMTFIRLIDGVDLNDPVEAANGRPVFELRSAR